MVARVLGKFPTNARSELGRLLKTTNAPLASIFRLSIIGPAFRQSRCQEIWSRFSAADVLSGDGAVRPTGTELKGSIAGQYLALLASSTLDVLEKSIAEYAHFHASLLVVPENIPCLSCAQQ